MEAKDCVDRGLNARRQRRLAVRTDLAPAVNLAVVVAEGRREQARGRVDRGGGAKALLL